MKTKIFGFISFGGDPLARIEDIQGTIRKCIGDNKTVSVINLDPAFIFEYVNYFRTSSLLDKAWTPDSMLFCSPLPINQRSFQEQHIFNVDAKCVVYNINPKSIQDDFSKSMKTDWNVIASTDTLLENIKFIKEGTKSDFLFINLPNGMHYENMRILKRSGASTFFLLDIDRDFEDRLSKYLSDIQCETKIHWIEASDACSCYGLIAYPKDKIFLEIRA